MTLLRFTVSLTLLALVLLLAGAFMHFVAFRSFAWFLPSVPASVGALRAWVMVWDERQAAKRGS